MYKGVNASEGIGIGTVAVAVEPDLSFEAHAVEDAAAAMEPFGARGAFLTELARQTLTRSV